MAGQPQEPSWTPAGQEQTQARPAWPQQPTFTPPPPAQQDAYGYPPPTAQPGYQGQEQAPPYGQEPAQAYGQEREAEYGQEPAPAYGQDQVYGSAEQTYAGQDQVYGSGGQQYQARPQGQPDPGATQWQAVPGMRPGRLAAGSLRSLGQQGFFSSLLDFSFTSMVTPKIIKVLYALFTVWTALWALYILALGFARFHVAGGLLVLFIIDPILIVLSLGVCRVILEGFMVVFRIYEETVKLREQGEREQSQP